VGKLLLQGLDAIRAKHPKVVKEVRGRGLLVGLDLVPPMGDVVAGCRERGLLVLTAGDNTLRLAPALIVTENEVAEACAIIDVALKAVTP
jgi:acetylornithine/succinyldiaminopimelate/putrescine aminotransferase